MRPCPPCERHRFPAFRVFSNHPNSTSTANLPLGNRGNPRQPIVLSSSSLSYFHLAIHLGNPFYPSKIQLVDVCFKVTPRGEPSKRNRRTKEGIWKRQSEKTRKNRRGDSVKYGRHEAGEAAVTQTIVCASARTCATADTGTRHALVKDVAFVEMAPGTGAVTDAQHARGFVMGKKVPSVPALSV